MPDTAPTRQWVVEMGREKREPSTTIVAALISTTNPAAAGEPRVGSDQLIASRDAGRAQPIGGS
jgi:hypothetical protein